MRREFLEDLGFDKDIIDKIMAEYGRAIESHKRKHIELESLNETLREQLKQRDEDMITLKMDVKDQYELRTKLEEMRVKYDADMAKRSAEMEELKQKHQEQSLMSALRIELSGKVHDADLIASLINKEKIALDDSGHIKSGLKDQIENLRKSKAFLFTDATRETPKATGIKPADGSKMLTLDKNPWDKDNLNLAEQGRIFKEDPAKARQLAEAAGLFVSY